MPRPDLRTSVLLTGLLLSSALGAGPSQAAEPGFSPAQRNEVVQILRDALRTDPSILRDALTALQADETRAQERAGQAALAGKQDQLVSDARDPVAGNPQGDVSLVYFYDTRCPYCRRMTPVLAELILKEPKLRVVFKDLPILGPASLLEARALLAAQRQGKYAAMQEAVMHGGGGQPTRESLRATAERLGMDGVRLLRDMDDPAVQAQLEANLALARELHMQGTPAIVVGSQLFPGAVEVPVLRKAIARARAG